ncbi:MAG: hypothetical protein ACLFM0_10535 [Spirochaetales bacterium]
MKRIFPIFSIVAVVSFGALACGPDTAVEEDVEVEDPSINDGTEQEADDGLEGEPNGESGEEMDGGLDEEPNGESGEEMDGDLDEEPNGESGEEMDGDLEGEL